MVIPVSLGNKTISLKIKDLTKYINIINGVEFDSQNEKIENQENLILQNKELINTLSESLFERINQLQEEHNNDNDKIKGIVDENEKVTALSLIDIKQIIENVSIRLSTLKNDSDTIHEQIINNQKEIDDSQNQRIDDIEDNVNLWEIYNND